ncbi:MAG: hypothetical protein A3D92_04515 [Bacteroidetes bacterium RIFCSPHIGHO2_02_FULL_44_7]|nr:MAG: hypothetical protein A3D92_04515 [Bacteroidetes bacterium RIFCSPHIGHO2_02_FULL_44_7]
MGATQVEIPVIYSSVDTLDIKDGNEFRPSQWTLVPEIRPDVYTSNRLGERVTFYTDSDSISWVLRKDVVFDFVIVRGSDSAFTQIAYAPTYLDILRGAATYNREVNSGIPAFTYQAASNPHLMSLRAALNLDSIAGNGDEISQIKNLMHWIHDLVPHDGSHENPEVKNAMSLIQQCKKEERGLNCRGLATVLNECYLAMGIPSRFVTCMPKDSIFDDCHVINMVYSKQLNKWIWMDPTHDAFVMDEKGNLLGLEEVRFRLIEGLPLVLNPSANWNNQVQTVKEFYLDEYMAKNLYRFECPLSSEYDFETRKRGKEVKYMELIPLDGYCQTPKYSSRKSRKSGVRFTVYKSNNPDQFWRTPVQ